MKDMKRVTQNVPMEDDANISQESFLILPRNARHYHFSNAEDKVAASGTGLRPLRLEQVCIGFWFEIHLFLP